jgi:gliding motility-associated-like protein
MLFIVGLLLLSLHCWGQQQQLTIEWDKTYGGDGYEELAAAITTNDGGYLYGGISTSRTPSFEVSTNTNDTVDYPELTGDYWLIKTDGQGNQLWDKRIGGNRQDRLWSIIQTQDGGYLIGGESRSGIGADRTYANRGDLDFWVIKLDASGNKIWDRAYGGTGTDILRKIIQLPNGQFWLAGFSNSPASFEKSSNSINNSDDYWCVRIDENGQPLGDFTIGGDSTDQVFDAILTSDGNIMMSGQSISSTGFDKTAPYYGYNDMWVVKCSPNGNILWDAAFGGNGQDVTQRLRPASDGNYFAIGHSTSDKMSGNKTAEHYGNDDAWIVKFADNSTQATMLWNRSFGGTSSDIGYDIVETSLGNLTFLGESVSSPDFIGKDAALIGGKDFWVIFLQPDGTKIWEESLGGLMDDVGRFAFLGQDYGYLFAGISNSNIYSPYKSEDARGNNTNDLWVVRTGCAFPPPNFEDLPKLCLDDVINIDATIPGPCDGCEYFWEDGATGPLRSISPDSTSEYKVTVLHPDGCELSDSLIIEIVPGPDGYQGSWTPISCYGVTDATFSIDSIGGIAPPFLFSFNGGEFEQTDSYYNLGAGIYNLEVIDTNGCTLDTSIYIPQPDSVMVDLGPDIFLEFGDSVQLQALTNLIDSFTFNWGLSSFLSCTDCLEPWVGPYFTTTFAIEVKDSNGCKASDNIQVIVQKEDAVYIPNAFSPNNLDNINDFFTVYAGRSVRRVRTLYVFDRWGELMFKNEDFQPNKPQIGWDGKFHDRFLDPAVFTYWTEVEYIDGRTEIFKGDLILMN